MNGDGSDYMVLHRFNGCTIDDSQMTLASNGQEYGMMLYGAVNSGDNSSIIFQMDAWGNGYTVIIHPTQLSKCVINLYK